MSNIKDANLVPKEKQISNTTSEVIDDDNNELNEGTSKNVNDSSGSKKRKHDNQLHRPASADRNNGSDEIICSDAEQPTCLFKKRYAVAQEEVHKLRHQLHSFKEIIEDMKTEMNELSQDILQFNNNVPEHN